MPSIASLLNPAPSGSPDRQPSQASITSRSQHSLVLQADPTRPHRLDPGETRYDVEATASGSKKPNGVVLFPPCENLDEAALRETRGFQIQPMGTIASAPRHIPYNSGKKDFFEKTGRESFEVFLYTFKVPGHETEYKVMWDYNIGLVRVTPFFKALKYAKTHPSKMLGKNPGLRDISYSITGGSIEAQGYWVPYSCAKAVCATFCYDIAGALIPIFGPDFPQECVRPTSSDFGHMVISPSIVRHCAKETVHFKRDFSHNVRPAFEHDQRKAGASSSTEQMHVSEPTVQFSGNPYTLSRPTYQGMKGPRNAGYSLPPLGFATPQRSSSPNSNRVVFEPAAAHAPIAPPAFYQSQSNPYLASVPRHVSEAVDQSRTMQLPETLGHMQAAEHMDVDRRRPRHSLRAEPSGSRDRAPDASATPSESESDAALSLLTLSMKGRESRDETSKNGRGEGSASPRDKDYRRSKRLRSKSD